MVQITQQSVISGAPDQIARWRREFSERHCVILPQLFSSGLLRIILQKIEAAHFYRHRHRNRSAQEFAWDLTVRENELALHVIHFLLNNPRVFSAIQEITGCRKIGSFAGRIYRTMPNQGHRLDWHDDAEHNERMLGISINLSTERYAGGLFQLREKQSERILCEIGSGNLGDAHLFLILPQLQHRVTPVEGEQARTSAAGWFLSEPDHLTFLKSLSCPTTPGEKQAS